jgi:hypothetical protein
MSSSTTSGASDATGAADEVLEATTLDEDERAGEGEAEDVAAADDDDGDGATEEEAGAEDDAGAAENV